MSVVLPTFNVADTESGINTGDISCKLSQTARGKPGSQTLCFVSLKTVIPVRVDHINEIWLNTEFPLYQRYIICLGSVPLSSRRPMVADVVDPSGHVVWFWIIQR